MAKKKKWISFALFIWVLTILMISHLSKKSSQLIVTLEIMSILVLLGIWVREIHHSEEMRRIDFLTGYDNRFGFLHKSHKSLRKRGYGNAYVLSFNVKDFKWENQVKGEAKADDVLIEIANIIHAHMQNDEVMCRSGMDRYLMLVFKKNDDEVNTFVNDVVNAIQTGIDDSILNFSIGVTQMHNTKSVRKAIFHAEYARQAGKIVNKARFFDAKLEQLLTRAEQLMHDFHEAIQKEEFEVYLQPIVPTSPDKPLHAEALVRWNHPRYGILTPDQFIPLFEKSERICVLDEYMFEHVCQIVSSWQSDIFKDVEISVNLSRKNLKNMGQRVCDRYQEIMQQYQIPEGLIELEVTESTMFMYEEFDEIKGYLEEFHRNGVLLGLDDFGFAYSALYLLKDFSVDYLKLDQKFFRNENDKSHVIVRKLIELAHELDMYVVAEGIEDQSQVAFLKNVGCDYIQGYYYGRPMPLKDFIQRGISYEGSEY